MSKAKFPQFNSYACIGDSITWHKDGFDITATLQDDLVSHVNHSECYSPVKIKQWLNDEWFFVGIVLSVEKNGVLIDNHASSLWGIECNYNKKANRYLDELARELESEAIETAKKRVEVMLKSLCARINTMQNSTRNSQDPNQRKQQGKPSRDWKELREQKRNQG